MKRIVFILFLLVFSSGRASAQELLCNVTVNAQKIASSDRTRFVKMQDIIRDFLNTHAWTPHVYNTQEKIICDITINLIEQKSETEYVANFVILSQRPVYQTIYASPVLKFMDSEVSFSYQDNMSMDFNEVGSNAPLVSVLAYWAYTIIGLDYDSFSVRGGTDYFAKAERIVQNQAANGGSWSPSVTGKRTRYKLNADLMDARYSDLRIANYKYYRQGMDQLASSEVRARSKVLEALLDYYQILKKKPDQNMVFFTCFFEAKADELVGIFSEAPANEKKQVYEMLKEMDNANESKYKKLIK